MLPPGEAGQKITINGMACLLVLAVSLIAGTISGMVRLDFQVQKVQSLKLLESAVE